MHRASCLCGAVTWEVDGELQFMSHCHCSRCRKARGVAFATEVAAPAAALRIAGAEHVVAWRSSPELERCFCRRCGASVPSQHAWQGMVFVPAGNFDDDPGLRPASHIFVASKAPWYEISDDLMRFDAYPDGIEANLVPDHEPLDPPGAPRGSCLCGAVAFVLEAAPIRGHHCHCGRCRKARSAAHASNLMAPIDGVRFTRGEDALASYKVPEAQFFTQVFCRVCGSKMPNRDRERGIAVVPMGAFDDDPGFRPQSHIFVGSKAPWFEIRDGLPQFEGRPS